jgi:hypothetical protein
MNKQANNKLRSVQFYKRYFSTSIRTGDFIVETFKLVRVSNQLMSIFSFNTPYPFSGMLLIRLVQICTFCIIDCRVNIYGSKLVYLGRLSTQSGHKHLKINRVIYPLYFDLLNFTLTLLFMKC